MGGAPFLPRVSVGRYIFSLARWRLSGRQLKSLRDLTPLKQYRCVQAWREEMAWPRWVALKDADNELPLDLDNILSIEAFINLVKGRGEATLVEMFPGTEELCVEGPEGLFAHEIVIPFTQKREVARQVRRSRPPTTVQRTFPPGSSWLYAKLYTGTATADEVLRNVVAPTVELAKTGKLASRWFFIRYADPGWHVRLRFQGAPGVLRGEVLAALNEACTPFVDDRRIRTMQLDTYEREVERYGGDQGIELSEALFEADSEAVLTIVTQLEGDQGATARWLLTLRGIDLLLQDLGFATLEAKLGIMSRVREEFGKEFRVENGLRHQLGERYRKERQAVEAILGDRGAQDYEPGYRAFERRSRAIAPIAEKLRALEKAEHLTVPMAAMVSSYVHMHANRLLRSHQRAQELVLYDFLCRSYESSKARLRRGGNTGDAKHSTSF